MPVSAALRRLILSHAETQEIEATAVTEGMRTMFDSGIDLALAGLTTVEEVLRVTRSCEARPVSVYRYKAVNAAGEVIEGTMDAPTRGRRYSSSTAPA